MTNKDDQLIDEPDLSIFEGQIDNEPVFEQPQEFEISHRVNIIEKLVHLTRFGNLLTLVVGSNGCGKTRLLEEFLSTIDDDCQICHIKAQPLLSIDQLFQQIIESFAGQATFTGIPLTANQYEEWAEQLTDISGNRLLIIDDAEVLSTSVLHELCQLSAIQQGKETAQLHLILFGNYDLNNILEQAADNVLDEDGIYAIDIPPLNNDEAVHWVEHLWEKTGMEFLPEQQDLEEILAKGQGNLHLLAELVDEMTNRSELDVFEDEPSQVSALGYWFASLTVLIILVLGLFFFQNEITSLIGMGNEEQVYVPQESTEVLDTSASVQLANEPELKVEELKSSLMDENEVIVDDDFEEGVVEENVVEENVVEENVVEENLVEENLVEENLVEENLVEENLVEENLVEENLVEENASVSDISISSEDMVDEASSVLEEDNLNPVDSELSQEGDILPLYQAAETYAFTEDEQLLMSESDDNYALQIIGLSKEGAVKTFLAEHNLSNMLYYRSALHDKPWFVVVLLSYGTRAEAVTARANLSEELKKNGPWIKSLKAIKKEILTAED